MYQFFFLLLSLFYEGAGAIPASFLVSPWIQIVLELLKSRHHREILVRTVVRDHGAHHEQREEAPKHAPLRLALVGRLLSSGSSVSSIFFHLALYALRTLVDRVFSSPSSPIYGEAEEISRDYADPTWNPFFFSLPQYLMNLDLDPALFSRGR